METLSSIREALIRRWEQVRLIYRLHPEAERYTWAVLFIIAALITRRWAAALVILASIGVMVLFDRYGRPWRDRGREMMSRLKPTDPNS